MCGMSAGDVPVIVTIQLFSHQPLFEIYMQLVMILRETFLCHKMKLHKSLPLTLETPSENGK